MGSLTLQPKDTNSKSSKAESPSTNHVALSKCAIPKWAEPTAPPSLHSHLHRPAKAANTLTNTSITNSVGSPRVSKKKLKKDARRARKFRRDQDRSNSATRTVVTSPSSVPQRGYLLDRSEPGTLRTKSVRSKGPAASFSPGSRLFLVSLHQTAKNSNALSAARKNSRSSSDCNSSKELFPPKPRYNPSRNSFSKESLQSKSQTGASTLSGNQTTATKYSWSEIKNW